MPIRGIGWAQWLSRSTCRLPEPWVISWSLERQGLARREKTVSITTSQAQTLPSPLLPLQETCPPKVQLSERLSRSQRAIAVPRNIALRCGPALDRQARCPAGISPGDGMKIKQRQHHLKDMNNINLRSITNSFPGCPGWRASLPGKTANENHGHAIAAALTSSLTGGLPRSPRTRP
jgi:hypothetical protein